MKETDTFHSVRVATTQNVEMKKFLQFALIGNIDTLLLDYTK